ncbi:hypothetical protein [Nocardioides zeae]
MAIAKRSIPELAARAERVLAARARAGTEPLTYGELAAAISDDERTYPANGMGPVLRHMGERGRYSWSGPLMAWAVSESGEPGRGTPEPRAALPTRPPSARSGTRGSRVTSTSTTRSRPLVPPVRVQDQTVR